MFLELPGIRGNVPSRRPKAKQAGSNVMDLLAMYACSHHGLSVGRSGHPGGERGLVAPRLLHLFGVMKVRSLV